MPFTTRVFSVVLTLVVAGCGSSPTEPGAAATVAAPPLRKLSREEALKLLSDMGAQVITDPSDASRVLEAHPMFHKYEWKMKDDDLAALAALPELQDVSLEATLVGDEGMRYLAGLTKLKHLNLESTKVTGAGLAQLKNLQDLEWLELFNSNIKGADLVHLQTLTKLETLDLKELPITDADLKPLASLKNLKDLHLTNTKVTDAGATELKKSLPNTDIWFSSDGHK